MARTYFTQTVLALLGAGCFAALGCGSLDSGVETCASQNNCFEGVEEVLTPDPAWECLTQPPPNLTQPSGAVAAYALPVVEWLNRLPLTGIGLTVTPCPSALSDCRMPAGMPYQPQPEMLGGMPVEIPMPLAPIPLREGFDGFLKFEVMEATQNPDGPYLPLAYYLGGPIASQVTINPLAILMIRRGTLDTVIRESFERAMVAENADTMVDRVGRGLVVLRAINCLGQPVAGARFTINREGIPFTLPASRLPIASPPPYGTPPTTEPADPNTGAAGFANVVPGTTEVQGFIGDNPVPFGTAEIGVVGGQITVAVIKPAYFNTAAVAPPMDPPAMAGSAN